MAPVANDPRSSAHPKTKQHKKVTSSPPRTAPTWVSSRCWPSTSSPTPPSLTTSASQSPTSCAGAGPFSSSASPTAFASRCVVVPLPPRSIVPVEMPAPASAVRWAPNMYKSVAIRVLRVCPACPLPCVLCVFTACAQVGGMAATLPRIWQVLVIYLTVTTLFALVGMEYLHPVRKGKRFSARSTTSTTSSNSLEVLT